VDLAPAPRRTRRRHHRPQHSGRDPSPTSAPSFWTPEHGPGPRHPHLPHLRLILPSGKQADPSDISSWRDPTRFGSDENKLPGGREWIFRSQARLQPYAANLGSRPGSNRLRTTVSSCSGERVAREPLAAVTAPERKSAQYRSRHARHARMSRDRPAGTGFQFHQRSVSAFGLSGERVGVELLQRTALAPPARSSAPAPNCSVMTTVRVIASMPPAWAGDGSNRLLMFLPFELTAVNFADKSSFRRPSGRIVRAIFENLTARSRQSTALPDATL
jgi:hypothetical protein